MGKERDFYLKIFEDFPALIWRSGTDMLCDYFNRTWLEFTGRTLDQERGNGWAEGVHPDDMGRCLEIYIANFAERKPFEMQYRLKRWDGEYRWIQDLGRPFYGFDGEFLGYIGSCYDVTEKMNMTLNLEKANRSKNLLFSIISHDLRGPLGGISHYLDLILEQGCSEPAEELPEMLGKLRKTAGEVNSLVENLLEWSRGQLESFQVNRQDLDLVRLWKEVLAAYQGALGKKELTASFEAPGSLPIQGDPDMLAVVFRNLLGNAVKFSNPGGLIQVRLVPDGAQVVAEVTDRGLGIPAKRLEGLFEIDPNKSTQGTAGEKGSGLGLLLCRDFTEKNGGSLHIASREGEGTTVTVRLPGSTW